MELASSVTASAAARSVVVTAVLLVGSIVLAVRGRSRDHGVTADAADLSV